MAVLSQTRVSAILRRPRRQRSGQRGSRRRRCGLVNHGPRADQHGREAAEEKRSEPTRLGRQGMKVAGLLAATTVRMWMSTLDYKGAFYDPTVDPVDPRCRGQKIYIFWHENILLPLYLRGQLQPGDAIEPPSRRRHPHSSWRGTWASSSCAARRSAAGASALRELCARSRHMNLAITPDGPRGPRRVLAQGPVYLSSKLGMPLVAMGFGYDRPWRLRSLGPLCHSQAAFAGPRGVVSPAMRHSAEPGSRGRGALSTQGRATAEPAHARSRCLGRSGHAQNRRDDPGAPARLVQVAPRSGAAGPASALGCRRRGRLAGWHWRFASGPLLVVSAGGPDNSLSGSRRDKRPDLSTCCAKARAKSSCCMRNTDNKLSVPPCGSSCTPKRRGRSRQRTWVSPARSPRRMALAFRQWAVARSLAGGPDNSLSGFRRDKRPDLSTCCAKGACEILLLHGATPTTSCRCHPRFKLHPEAA